MNRVIRIGTRGSVLAIKQAEEVRDAILPVCPLAKIEIVTIKTTGDKIMDKTLDKIGGKGVFVKEIERALLQGDIDIAVHSRKDMPEEMPEGLMLGAVLKRQNPMDVLITKDGKNISNLPQGAKIGTGSLRRKVQLLEIRPDFEIVPIRGNIHTRLQKLHQGLDGLVLAAAGLKRCGLSEQITQYFSLNEMIPASGQGVLGVQIREQDITLRELLAKVNDWETDICQKAERAFLAGIGADCHTPAGAFAKLDGDFISVTAMFYEGEIYKVFEEGQSKDAEVIGKRLAKKILQQRGGKRL